MVEEGYVGFLISGFRLLSVVVCFAAFYVLTIVQTSLSCFPFFDCCLWLDLLIAMTLRTISLLVVVAPFCSVFHSREDVISVYFSICVRQLWFHEWCCWFRLSGFFLML